MPICLIVCIYYFAIGSNWAWFWLGLILLSSLAIFMQPASSGDDPGDPAAGM